MAKRGDLILRIRAQTKAAQKQMARFNRELRMAGVNAKTSGRNIGMARTQMSGMASAAARFIAPAVAIAGTARLISAAVTTYADFGRKVKLVGLISGSTAEQVVAMSVAAKMSAKEMGKAPVEIAEAYQALASAGLKTNQVIAAGSDTLKLAALRGGDYATVARAMAAAIKLFNINADKSEEIASKFATTVSRSLFANVNELAESFKFAGSAGTAFKKELGEVLASLAGFMNATQDASMAGTSFRMTLIKLVKEPTARARKELQRLGLTMKELNPETHNLVDVWEKLARSELDAKAAAEIFGRRAGPALAGFINMVRTGQFDVRALADEINTSAGRVTTEFKTFMADMRGEIDKTKASWNLFKIDLGKKLGPTMEGALKELRVLLGATSDLMKPGRVPQKRRLIKPLGESLKELAGFYTPSAGAAIGETIATRGPGPAIKRALDARWRSRQPAVQKFEETHPGAQVGGFGLDQPTTIIYGNVTTNEVPADADITPPGT